MCSVLPFATCSTTTTSLVCERTEGKGDIMKTTAETVALCAVRQCDVLSPFVAAVELQQGLPYLKTVVLQQTQAVDGRLHPVPTAYLIQYSVVRVLDANLRG